MLSKKLFLSSTVLIVLITLPLIGSVGASSEMWSRTYGGASSDYAEAMVQTSDGGFALAGYTRSFGAGSYDFWLAKTDEHGVIPEFPSWAVLPLLITATLVIMVCKKRLPKNLSNQQKSFISGD